jgi:hypothetical protein
MRCIVTPRGLFFEHDVALRGRSERLVHLGRLHRSTLERLVLGDGAYVIAASLEGEETFRPESFEGMEVPLSKLWG